MWVGCQFISKPMTPNPNRILYPFRRSIMNFRPDPARSHRYSTKSRADLDGSSQISARSRWIRPDFDPMINPRLTRINPKSTRPKPKNLTKSPGRFWVKFFFTHLIQVESGLDINLTWSDPWTTLVLTVTKWCRGYESVQDRYFIILKINK